MLTQNFILQIARTTHVEYSYVPPLIFRTKFASEALTLLRTCAYVRVYTYVCTCTYRREQAATRVEHQGEYLCPPPPRQRRYGVQDLYWSPHRARASSREFREERGGGVGTEIGSNGTSERDWRVGKSEGEKKTVILERIEIERGERQGERAEGKDYGWTSAALRQRGWPRCHALTWRVINVLQDNDNKPISTLTLATLALASVLALSSPLSLPLSLHHRY